MIIIIIKPIPKYPETPKLTDVQIEEMTNICFLEVSDPTPCDAIFLFGGSHPGNLEKPLEAYQRKLGNRIIITGDSSFWGMKHPSWKHGDGPQAGVIVSHLLSNGVPKDVVFCENRSKHSLENVLFAKEIFNFNKIKSLLFITKSYATGRQWRILTKHLPSHIKYVPYPFDTSFTKEEPIMTRHNWMKTPKNCALVFGEYLRIACFSLKGDITPLENPIIGLDDYVKDYIG